MTEGIVVGFLDIIRSGLNLYSVPVNPTYRKVPRQRRELFLRPAIEEEALRKKYPNLRVVRFCLKGMKVIWYEDRQVIVLRNRLGISVYAKPVHDMVLYQTIRHRYHLAPKEWDDLYRFKTVRPPKEKGVFK